MAWILIVSLGEVSGRYRPHLMRRKQTQFDYARKFGNRSPTRLAFGVLTVCLKESVGLGRAAGSPVMGRRSPRLR